MSPKEAQEKFILEYNTELEQQVFPAEFLPEDFSHYKHAALQYESVVSINLPWSVYKAFVMKSSNDNYTLLDVATVCNMMERRTPAELTPIIDENYYSVMDRIQKIGEKWRELEAPIQERLKRKLSIGAISMNGQQKTRFGRGSNFNR